MKKDKEPQYVFWLGDGQDDTTCEEYYDAALALRRSPYPSHTECEESAEGVLRTIGKRIDVV